MTSSENTCHGGRARRGAPHNNRLRRPLIHPPVTNEPVAAFHVLRGPRQTVIDQSLAGVPHVTVPDWVVKCHRYDPDLSEDYAYLAAARRGGMLRN